MADCVPFFLPGQAPTCHTSSAVVGQRFVRITGASVEGNTRVGAVVAAAGDTFGVAARDAGIGEKVTVYKAGAIVPVEAAAAIAAGQEVETNNIGQAVVLAAGKARGKATDDIANGSTGPIELYQ